MNVSALFVEAIISESHSLKEKRMVVKSVKDRIRQRFNVAVAELDSQDKWQKVSLGFVTLGPSKLHCSQVLDRIESLLDEDDRLENIQFSREELA